MKYNSTIANYLVGMHSLLASQSGLFLTALALSKLITCVHVMHVRIHLCVYVFMYYSGMLMYFFFYASIMLHPFGYFYICDWCFKSCRHKWRIGLCTIVRQMDLEYIHTTAVTSYSIAISKQKTRASSQQIARRFCIS